MSINLQPISLFLKGPQPRSLVGYQVGIIMRATVPVLVEAFFDPHSGKVEVFRGVGAFCELSCAVYCLIV